MARILVCDDAIFMRTTIREILESGGHEVVAEAEDPVSAFERYKSLRPDLVTMDLLMKAPGVDAIKEIRAFDPKAKIIVVSVLAAQEADVIEAIRNGAVGLVSKPIKKELLLGEVERVLGQRK